MKKILLTLGVVLTFGIASAQVPPTQPQQAQPDPVTTKKDAEIRARKDANMQKDRVDPANAPQGNDVQPMKDELKTRNHVKSTPDPAITKDTINSKRTKTTNRPKRRQ
jgi:hypothetical protein